VIKSKFGDRVDDLVRRALPFLLKSRLNPNLLTVVGAIVSLVAAVVFARGGFVLGGCLMLAGGAFDLVDGVIARSHGVATRFGAFLDSTLDRLGDMAVLLGITMYYAIAGEPGHVLLAGWALVSSVLVSYAQARAELVVPSFKVGFLERGERVGILAAGALFGFMVPALWIVAVGSSVTFVQRFAHAYREMEQLDASERTAAERT
jgi:CDP-diacylglycerol--glycerol-3-phosphate 3-phosphatidyltransferase